MKKWITGPIALLVAVNVVGFTIDEINKQSFGASAAFVGSLLPIVLGVGLLVGGLTLIPGLKGL